MVCKEWVGGVLKLGWGVNTGVGGEPRWIGGGTRLRWVEYQDGWVENTDRWVEYPDGWVESKVMVGRV